MAVNVLTLSPSEIPRGEMYGTLFLPFSYDRETEDGTEESDVAMKKRTWSIISDQPLSLAWIPDTRKTTTPGP